MSAIYGTARCHIRVGIMQLISCQQWDCHKRFLLCLPKDINDDNAFELLEYFSQLSILPYKGNVREWCSNIGTSFWALGRPSGSAEEQVLYHLAWHWAWGQRHSLGRQSTVHCLSMMNRGVIKVSRVMDFSCNIHWKVTNHRAWC